MSDDTSELRAEILDHPDCRCVLAILGLASADGVDVHDPEVLRSLIATGETVARAVSELPRDDVPAVRRRPTRAATRSVVYYVCTGRLVKIGTTTDLDARLSALGHPDLLAVEPGGYDLERRRHRQFRSLRILGNREWFRHERPLTDHIEQLTECPTDWLGQGGLPRADDAAMTLSEAVELLDPSMNLRTLQRHVRGRIEHVGHRPPAGPGKPARTYWWSDLLAIHAAWVRGEVDGRRI